MPYINAFYNKASREGDQTLKKVYEDFLLIAEFCKDSHFLSVLNNPTLSVSQVNDFFKATIFAHTSPTTKSMIDVLMSKDRISDLPDMAKGFVNLYQHKNNIVKVYLTLAKAMDQAKIDKLVAKYTQGKQAEIYSEIQPDLIGGYIIQIDQNRHDTSVKYKLNQVSNQILS